MSIRKSLAAVMALLVMFSVSVFSSTFAQPPVQRQVDTQSVWNIETIDSDVNAGWDTSIALDSGDNPHISYHDRSYDDLKYAYGDLRTPTVLKLTLSTGEAHPGEWVTLSGRLIPGLANKQIFLYYRITYQWKYFGTVTTDQQGRYSYQFKIPESVNPPITVQFVAFFPGTDYHMGVVSPIRELSITSPLT